MAELNEIIHQPVRLRIMAVLVSFNDETQASFNYLKDVLNLTDGNLGAHLHKLEEAGYIDITKTFLNNKPRGYCFRKARFCRARCGAAGPLEGRCIAREALAGKKRSDTT